MLGISFNSSSASGPGLSTQAHSRVSALLFPIDLSLFNTSCHTICFEQHWFCSRKQDCCIASGVLCVATYLSG